MIEIRRAISQDDTAITEVDTAAIATLRRTYRPTAAAHANRAKLSVRLMRLVATIDGRVVGTARYFVENDRVRIIGLGVHSDFRRQGVARALLNFLESIGKSEGATRLSLSTIKETGNVDVFLRLGFHIVAEQKDEFCESDIYAELIDVEMTKSLK